MNRYHLLGIAVLLSILSVGFEGVYAFRHQYGWLREMLGTLMSPLLMALLVTIAFTKEDRVAVLFKAYAMALLPLLAWVFTYVLAINAGWIADPILAAGGVLVVVMVTMLCLMITTPLSYLFWRGFRHNRD